MQPPAPPAAPMQPPEAPQGALDQFLQPQSMVTPGALGAIAMMGTNAIARNFSYMSLPFTALLLSGLFGLAALVKSLSIAEKILYYVLNTIVIFSVATGSNKIGQQIQRGASLSLPSLAAYAASNSNMDARAATSEKVQFFKEWFGDQTKGYQIPIPTSRAAWSQMFMLTVRPGTYNVIVSSLGGNLDKARDRKIELCNRFPNVEFRLWSTIALEGGNLQYTIVIGYGLDQRTALGVAVHARTIGIAPDAYIVPQRWEVPRLEGETCP